jgi:hypothetical protein
MMRLHRPDGASQKQILWSYPAVAKTTLIVLVFVYAVPSGARQEEKGAWNDLRE